MTDQGQSSFVDVETIEKKMLDDHNFNIYVNVILKVIGGAFITDIMPFHRF